MSGAGSAVPERIGPRLIALTDRSVATAAETLTRFERVARTARPYSVMFQLRDRELPAAERLAFGRELRALCTRERQWFQVNDRCDLAVLLGADGVHLGEASVTTADARRVVGAGAFVSRACHDPECALDTSVDAWVLSPVFEERKGRAALGVGAVSRLASRCGDAVAVFGLGGVTAANAADCVRNGGVGVAVIGAVLTVGEPERLLEALGIAVSA